MRAINATVSSPCGYDRRMEATKHGHARRRDMKGCRDECSVVIIQHAATFREPDDIQILRNKSLQMEPTHRGPHVYCTLCCSLAQLHLDVFDVLRLRWSTQGLSLRRTPCPRLHAARSMRMYLPASVCGSLDYQTVAVRASVALLCSGPQLQQQTRTLGWRMLLQCLRTMHRI